MERLPADLVVVGSGLAGLACALRAPGRVVVLTKTDVAEGGSSYWAQGGIAAALGPGDTPAAHAADTLAVAGGIALPAAVESLTAAAPATVRMLADLGVPFGRAHGEGERGGALALGREAAHGAARIAHAGGDATGRHVCDALLRAVRARPNVTLLEGCFAFDLLVAKDAMRGVLAYDDGRGWLVLRAPRVVLAAGGIGALWAETTNPPEATGDGLAMAARAGARLADLEFVQFHPTALATPSGGDGRLPLLSEALRGAGALLVDDRGRRFMPDEDPRAELAPRDVVARAVFRQRAGGREVLLDLRPALAHGGTAAFPSALDACRRAGYRPEAAPVPVLPAAHYHMGGVLADLDGRTSLPGLWACGETACTGVHGANRLASNSLLEALVAGGRVADAAAAYAPPPCAAEPPFAVPGLPDPAGLPALRLSLGRLAARRLGVERDRAGLEAALLEVADVQRSLGRLPAGRLGGGSGWLAAVRAHGELRNLRLVARLVAATALAREESRGAHFRRDHPEPRPEWCRRQTVTLAEVARGEPCRAVAPDLAWAEEAAA